ncbi:MAG: hypothetical protein ABI615_07680 [Chthoniobacterales bacterium]
MRSISITRCPTGPFCFRPPFEGEDYALLLYVAATDISSEEQTLISRDIIASGCRYAVCFGHDCSSWDDAIDWAVIDAGKGGKGFVMTTWHERDTLEEVLHFFWHHTSFDNFSAIRMGIFVLGLNPENEELLERGLNLHNETNG